MWRTLRFPLLAECYDYEYSGSDRVANLSNLIFDVHVIAGRTRFGGTATKSAE
jgi:hypothetical protein